MTDKSWVSVVSGARAVIGGLAGFLFCTTQGRALLQRIAPALEDLSRELSGFGQTIIGDANDVTLRWFAQQFHYSVWLSLCLVGPTG